MSAGERGPRQTGRPCHGLGRSPVSGAVNITFSKVRLNPKGRPLHRRPEAWDSDTATCPEPSGQGGRAPRPPRNCPTTALKSDSGASWSRLFKLTGRRSGGGRHLLPRVVTTHVWILRPGGRGWRNHPSFSGKKEKALASLRGPAQEPCAHRYAGPVISGCSKWQ